MPTNIEAIHQAGLEFIARERDESEPHPGHETGHLISVARLSDLAGLAANFPQREQPLYYIAGLMHDLVRSPSEASDSKDEELSAYGAERFMIGLNQSDVYPNSSRERAAVMLSIVTADRVPPFFEDPIEAWDLTDRVTAALFVGDKLEQNGVWVIARRSQFVAGARLKATNPDGTPKGDLARDWGLKPEQDEVKAVLLESAMRLAFLNPENSYPSIFKVIASPLYQDQRPFVMGLLAASDMTLEGYAHMLLNTWSLKNPTKNYVSDRPGIEVPSSEEALVTRLHDVAKLSNPQIEMHTGAIADAAIEAVNYFSDKNNYQRDLTDLIRDWRPPGLGQIWHDQMREYADGRWYESMKARILASRNE